MESTSQDLFQVLRNVLTQLPSLLTLLICLVISIVRWRRHPKVSLVASLAFVFLILHALIFSAAYIWIPRWFLDSSVSESHRTFFSVFALIANFLFAIAMATLLLAVFIDRKRASGRGRESL
jgi:hypothetical protein